MPAIPYSPVPQVNPVQTPIDRVRVDTPVAAFGGATAEATQELGKDVSGAGNELFQRAVAMQELNNETDAKNANVEFIGKAGDLHAKFSELQGQERVAAFPKYQQDLSNLYQTTRGALGNPSAQRMFDGAAISTLNRSIFNAAGAAATAQSEAARSAANAEFAITTKGVYNDPNDEGAFRDAIAKSDSSAVTKAALSPGGASPESVAYIQQQGRSEIAANRILGMARNQPYQASQLLKQYKDEGLLFGKDAEMVDNKVQSLTETVGTNAIANQVLGKYLQSDGTFSKSSKDMQAEAVDLATKTYPDDPKMESAARAAFDHNVSQHQYSKMMDDRATQQQVNEQQVKGVMTVDQLPPDLVKQMTPAQIKQYPGEANKYKASVDVQTNEADYHRLLGLYNNDNAKFMGTNIINEPGLSKSNIDYFTKLQRSANANGDPRVAGAMKWLNGYAPQTLNDLGVTGKGKDEATSNHFVGALHDAIQSWQETTGKPPNEQQLTKEIYPNLLTKVTDPNGWFASSETEYFRAGLPKDVVKQAEKAKGASLTGPELDSLQHDLNRLQFNKLFSARAKTQDKAP